MVEPFLTIIIPNDCNNQHGLIICVFQFKAEKNAFALALFSLIRQYILILYMFVMASQTVLSFA